MGELRVRGVRGEGGVSSDGVAVSPSLLQPLSPLQTSPPKLKLGGDGNVGSTTRKWVQPLEKWVPPLKSGFQDQLQGVP